MADRPDGRKEGRRKRILDSAREKADVEGWSAVTTRHLAGAIGYTQPVLYSHFPGGKEEIMRTLALDGFVELARRAEEVLQREQGRAVVEGVARAYLAYAEEHPGIYEAMFQLPLDATFASPDSESELRAGFAVLARAIGDDSDGARTEVFWGSLHGIALLERAGRMRPEHREHRVEELGGRFGGGAR